MENGDSKSSKYLNGERKVTWRMETPSPSSASMAREKREKSHGTIEIQVTTDLITFMVIINF